MEMCVARNGEIYVNILVDYMGVNKYHLKVGLYLGTYIMTFIC